MQNCLKITVNCIPLKERGGLYSLFTVYGIQFIQFSYSYTVYGE
jgi:hypothetical protein